MDWGPIIAAGVSLAGDFLEQDTREQQQAQSLEQTILNLQQSERESRRSTEGALERAQLAADTQLQLGQMSLEGAKKRILGDVLLQQGQGQEKLGIEAFRAAANKPERFTTAASVLSQVLAR